MLISVHGESHVEVAPERAVASLSVSVDDATRVRALERITATLAGFDERLGALRESGAVEKFRADAVRTWAGHEGRFGQERVYATATIAAHFLDFEALGRFLTDAAARDGVALQGVTWCLTDATERARRDECIAGAVARATGRAQAMAHAAGAGEVRIVEIADPGLLGDAGGGGMAGAPRFAMMKATLADDALGVEPEDVRVEVALQLRFEA